MKLTCTQGELSTHLGIVARAVSSRPSRPVLANILVRADSETQSVTLVGFDEVLGIETRFSAQVEEPGTLTLPAKLWGDIVSRLADEDLIIEAEGTTVTITSSSGRYEVRGLSAEDYPAIPTVEGMPFALGGDALLLGLRGCLFATSGDETKQILQGVNFSIAGEDL